MQTKQHFSVIAAIILCVVMAACGSKQSGEQQKEQVKQKTTAQKTKPSEKPIATINIYRYDDFSEAKAEKSAGSRSWEIPHGSWHNMSA
jgi:uncharacterized lipoprotein